MLDPLLIAIFAGLGGMFGWGFADFSAKKTIDEIGDVSTLVWGHVFGTIALVLFVSYKNLFDNYQIIFPNDLSIWLYVAFFGFLQAAVYYFLFKGFGKGQVSILSPIFASFSAITALSSIIFFGEAISLGLLVALFLIFIGISSVNLDYEILKTRKFAFTKVLGFKEVVIATLLASFWTLFWGKFINGQDWLLYTVIMYTFMTFFIFILARLQKTNLKVANSSLWKFLALIGVGEVVAYLAISYGYGYTSYISVVALLSGAFSLPVIVLAYFILKEKVTRIQTFGSILIVIGIMALALT